MRFAAFVLLAMLFVLPVTAQNGFAEQSFGFGFDDEDDGTDASGATGGMPLAVSIGGEVSASLLGYIGDFADGADKVRPGDIFSGKLNFSAASSRADAVVNLKLRPPADSPIAVDEAYVRAYFGSLDIEGGLRKLTWGKADSFGPLDVINPLDNSEMTDMSDVMSLKIARPLIHVSYRIGSFSKIEGVFVPTFEPVRLADKGNRWRPAQMARLDQIEAASVPVNHPDTATLNYAQAGVRFTTTAGSADIGFQYYYGRLTRPAVILTPSSPPSPLPAAVDFAYNPYHQIGVDWARVLFGFNVRAEAAVNITEDTGGDDGAVYNPHLVWSFGFDRDLFWGVNLNIQTNETVMLLHNKIADPLDVEADAGITSTRIIAALSKNFFRDELEARAAVIWEPEAGDFLVTPSLVWTKDAVSVELSGGIFGGKADGQFGQYRDNGFVKAGIKYMF
jgi:hypothetical protein